MEDNCLLCQSDDLDKESDQIVCKSCGYFEESIAATLKSSDGPALMGTSYVPDGHSTSSSSSYLPTHMYTCGRDRTVPTKVTLKQLGYYQIDPVCNALGLTGNPIIEECWDLFAKVYQHKEFIKSRQHRKRCLAVSCVLITCSNHGYPASLLQLSNLTGFYVEEIAAGKRDILRCLGIECKYVDIEELVSPIGSKLGFPKAIVDMGIQIIQLCKDVCLTSGCVKEHIIIAALYISWQAQGLPNNAKITLKKFMAKNKLSQNATVAIRYREMKKILMKLCGSLPYITSGSTVTYESLLYHLKDVIDHWKLLMAEHRAKININTEQDEKGNEEHKTGDADLGTVKVSKQAACDGQSVYRHEKGENDTGCKESRQKETVSKRSLDGESGGERNETTWTKRKKTVCSI